MKNAATTFASCGISPELCRRLQALDIVTPTAIQAQGLPVVLQGRDAIIRARTGTGKTLLYLLPALQRMERRGSGAELLVLCPTRELAQQVAVEAKSFGAGLTELRVVMLGAGLEARAGRSRMRLADIAIATPGKLLEMLQEQPDLLLSLDRVVLDEADRLLEMGFAEQVEAVLKACPKDTQRLACSATWPDSLRDLCEKYLRQPAHLQDLDEAGGTIQEVAFNVYPENQLKLSAALLQRHRPAQTLIFCNHIERAAEVAAGLPPLAPGFVCAVLHGELSPAQRDAAMKGFRAGTIQVLVATDLASRGLDIPDLPLVINYDTPYDVADYVHRCGRAGRAGSKGLVVSFYNGKAVAKIHAIEKRTGRAMKYQSFNMLMKELAQATVKKARKPTLQQSRRLLVPLGSKHGFTKGELLKLLREHAGIKDIDIAFSECKEGVTQVALAADKAQAALVALSGLSWKGRLLLPSLK